MFDGHGYVAESGEGMSDEIKIGAIVLGIVLFAVGVWVFARTTRINGEKRWAEYVTRNNCRVVAEDYRDTPPSYVLVGKVIVPVVNPPHLVATYKCDDGKTWERSGNSPRMELGDGQ